jgi:hypothetical protein
VLKGGEIGEEVCSVRKVTRETKGTPSSSVNKKKICFSSVKLIIFLVFSKISPNFQYHKL